MTGLSFYVDGTPRPQGSKRYLGGGRFIDDAPDLKAWRSDVRNAAQQALNGGVSHWWDCPVSLDVAFCMPRPKSHYLPANTRRPQPVLRADAPTFHTGTPDADKLLRAVFDALTGLVWLDDKTIAVLRATKMYADRPGAHIAIRRAGVLKVAP